MCISGTTYYSLNRDRLRTYHKDYYDSNIEYRRLKSLEAYHLRKEIENAPEFRKYIKELWDDYIKNQKK